jgi:hypothetical protein
MMSVERVRERGRGECGLTFSPARGVVCSKRGGIREVSAENKKTNFFTGSESQPPPPRQAFGGGVWAGRRALLGSDAESLPAFLSPPAGADWPDTEWADYYAFGRWTVLLWALANMDYPGQDWRQHQGTLERLLTNLTKRLPTEEEGNRAIAALKSIQPLLEVVQRQANEQVRAELSRGLEITMQQLAP